MIPETLERKTDISNATPARHTLLRATAESLSLHNVDLAVTEVLNEALTRMVHLAYDGDAGGFCNVDGTTGRVLIPLPWGRNGKAKWGLRTSEADILREILFTWEREGVSLFHYDRARRSWFVMLRDYANIHLAKKWLATHQVSVGMYREMRTRLVAGG